MSPSPDTRRVANRILAHEALNLLSEFAHANGGDVLALLVFTGVWTSNTAHLRDSRDRYAGLYDVPPDSQRRPVSEEDLNRLLCIPRDIQDRYVAALIGAGLVERVGGGLVAPAAVFTRPVMLQGANEIYARLVEMMARLRQVGVALGADETDPAAAAQS